MLPKEGEGSHDRIHGSLWNGENVVSVQRDTRAQDQELVGILGVSGTADLVS